MFYKKIYREMENHNFPERLSIAPSNGEAGGIKVSVVRVRFINSDTRIRNKITYSQRRPRTRLITRSRDGLRLTSLNGVIECRIVATFKDSNDARGGLAG